jgi:peptide/nickel transport system permease protein
LITLWIVTVIIFLGVHALPGSPALVLAGEQGADAELVAGLTRRYGLDQPLVVQYFKWLGQVLQGNFGRSITSQQPVSQIMVQRIPITLELGLAAMLIATVIGLTLGVLGAARRNKPVDHAGNVLSISLLSVPNFWVGLLLIALVAVKWKFLPASGWVPFTENPADNIRHLLMPAVVLGTGLIALVMRQTRSTMLETLDQDFIRTAYAKGLSQFTVVVKHGLRNSLVTVITVIGLQLGVLLAGSVVTEQIFLIPGFGKLLVEAVDSRDYPVIQAVALISAIGYVLINFCVDILYSVLNPRIRLQGVHS